MVGRFIENLRVPFLFQKDYLIGPVSVLGIALSAIIGNDVSLAPLIPT